MDSGNSGNTKSNCIDVEINDFCIGLVNGLIDAIFNKLNSENPGVGRLKKVSLNNDENAYETPNMLPSNTELKEDMQSITYDRTGSIVSTDDVKFYGNQDMFVFNAASTDDVQFIVSEEVPSSNDIEFCGDSDVFVFNAVSTDSLQASKFSRNLNKRQKKKPKLNNVNSTIKSKRNCTAFNNNYLYANNKNGLLNLNQLPEKQNELPKATIQLSGKQKQLIPLLVKLENQLPQNIYHALKMGRQLQPVNCFLKMENQSHPPENQFLKNQDQSLQPVDTFLENQNELPKPTDQFLTNQDQLPQPINTFLENQNELLKPADQFLKNQDQLPQSVNNFLENQDQLLQPVNTFLENENELPKPTDQFLTNQDQLPQPLNTFLENQNELPKPADQFLKNQNQLLQPVNTFLENQNELPKLTNQLLENQNLLPQPVNQSTENQNQLPKHADQLLEKQNLSFQVNNINRSDENNFDDDYELEQDNVMDFSIDRFEFNFVEESDNEKSKTDSAYNSVSSENDSLHKSVLISQNSQTESNVRNISLLDFDLDTKDNQDEHLDHDNKKWEAAKNLSNDKERFNFVHNQWQLKKRPNPFRDLTRRFSGRGGSTKARNSSNSMDCEAYFKKEIARLDRRFGRIKKNIDDEETFKLNKLRKEYIDIINNRYIFSFERYNYERELLEKERGLKEFYERRKDWELCPIESEIRRLKANKKEVLHFMSFYKVLYKDNPEALTLTSEHQNELKRQNDIFDKLDNFYS